MSPQVAVDERKGPDSRLMEAYIASVPVAQRAISGV